MSVRPTILLYNFTDKRRRTKIQTFCAMNGIRVRMVEREQYGKPVIALVDKEAEILFGEERAFSGINEEKRDEEQVPGQADFVEEMLVMCQVGGKMNGLLAWLRKENVIVPLKAVMTQTNQFWTSLELYHEIKREHGQMTGQG